MSRPVRSLYASIRLRPSRSLFSASGNERLAAEARIHRHDQHEVELVHHVIEIIQRGGRVEHEAGLQPLIADQRQRAVDVVATLPGES